MNGFGMKLPPPVVLVVVTALLAVLTVQHSRAQETELEIPPGDIRARIGDAEETITLSDLRIEPRLLVDSSGETVHAFGKDGPFVVILRGAQDYSEAPPAYGLKFAIAPSAGSGTVVSNDPSVISLVKQDFAGADADAGGVITRRLVTGQPGSTRLTITWQTSAGQVVTVGIDVTVTPIDLSIAGVPDFAEYDAGGFVKTGELIELELSYPTGRAPDLPDAWNIYTSKNVGLAAIKGGDRFRLWQDRAKTRQLSLPLDLDAQSGPRRLFLEPTDASTNVRDIELRLSVAGLVSIQGWDTVALTAIQLALETRSDVVGQNDDDDNANNEKDVLEIATAVTGENDLLPLFVKVQPFVKTFGRRSLELSAGLSLWKSVDKGGVGLMIDGLNNVRGPIELEHAESDVTLHLEGVALNRPGFAGGYFV